MLKALPIVVMDYNELISNHYYVANKTLMIKDFLFSKRKVTLITRLRRWKTSFYSFVVS